MGDSQLAGGILITSVNLLELAFMGVKVNKMYLYLMPIKIHYLLFIIHIEFLQKSIISAKKITKKPLNYTRNPLTCPSTLSDV